MVLLFNYKQVNTRRNAVNITLSEELDTQSQILYNRRANRWIHDECSDMGISDKEWDSSNSVDNKNYILDEIEQLKYDTIYFPY